MAKFDVTTSNQYIKGYVEYIETFGDDYLETNKSTVTATLFLHRTNSYSGDPTSSTSCSCSFVIDGETITKNLGKITIPNGGAYANCGSASKEITHNDDGSKEITISVSYVMNYINLTANASSGTIKLTTIPRASEVACSSPYIGDNAIISIDKKSSAFTNTVTYKIGTLTGTVAIKASSTTLQLNTSEISDKIYALMPDDKEIQGTIYCTTYNGDTQIGDTKSTTFNLYAKESSCKPDISAIIVDTNTNVTDITDKFIKYISKPKVTINVTAKNSATIKNYSINLNDGQTSNLQENTFDTIGSNKVTVSVTDSRGYSNSKDYTLDMIDYIKLHINNLAITRPEGTSKEAILNCNGAYFNGAFTDDISNTLTATFKYRLSGATEWIDGGSISPTITDNIFEFTDLSLGKLYDYNEEYQFRIILQDKFSTDNGTDSLEKGQEIVTIGEDSVWIYGNLKLNDKDVIAIESGSGSNGSWTKYADGTIEQWGTYIISSDDVSWTALGTALFYSPSYSHTLPVTLINTDNINTTCAVSSRSANFDWAVRPAVGNTDAPDISVTDTVLSFNLVTATNTKRNVVIRWFVKGRWKE